jgi:hypothetical protein
VKKLWVEGQLEYFHRSSRNNESELLYVDALIRTCIQLVVLIGLGTAIAAVITELYRIQDREWIAWPVIALEFFLGAAALLHHASYQRAYDQHTKQFRRMETIFRKAHFLIQQNLDAHDLKRAQNYLHMLGYEALFENADWVLLHRERPMELPHP